MTVDDCKMEMRWLEWKHKNLPRLCRWTPNKFKKYADAADRISRRYWKLEEKYQGGLA